MTIHAADEMAEDDLDLLDIEEVVLNGHVVKRDRVDPRGTKYTVEGALHEKSDFSVQPLCLCVSVVVFTNNSLTTEAQRHRGSKTTAYRFIRAY